MKAVQTLLTRASKPLRYRTKAGINGRWRLSDPLLMARDGHVATLTINRPDTRNALGETTDLPFWLDAIQTINADRAIRAVILTGAGKAFSAGGNIKAMREQGGTFAGPGVHIREGYRNNIHKLAKAVWSLEVPVIAAVNGPAIGLGCDVTCLCDIRIAAQSAIFGVTFLKLGLVPGDGGAWLLPRAIGMARASELFYTGDTISAETAERWGLVSRVVPDQELMATARVLADKIAIQPPDVLRMTKRLLREGQHASYETILEMSAAYQALAHHTEDHREALEAFFEKRPPHYQGR